MRYEHISHNLYTSQVDRTKQFGYLSHLNMIAPDILRHFDNRIVLIISFEYSHQLVHT